MSNEDRPREISFKKPPKKTIPRVRIKRKIDPRFKKQYGSFNETHFRDNYKFLDELEEEEIENIKSDMRHSKSREEKSRLGKKLIKLNSKLQTRKYNDALREKKSDLLKRERSLTKKGKKMFFPKQSDIKKLVMRDKFEQLKKEGNLERFINKKKKRLNAKHKRNQPEEKGNLIRKH